MPLLGAFEIFDPRGLPATRTAWEAVAHNYGNQALDVLLDWYGKPRRKSDETVVAAYVRPDLCRVQWRLLVTILAHAWYAHLDTPSPAGVSLEAHHAEFIDQFYVDILQGAQLVEISLLA